MNQAWPLSPYASTQTFNKTNFQHFPSTVANVHVESALVDVLRADGDPIVCMAVSENGVVIATGCADGRLLVWRTDLADTVKLYCEFSGHQAYVRDILIFYPQILTASGDGTVKKWHLPSKQLVQTWRGHEASITVMVLLGGSVFTASHDESVIMWDYNTGAPIVRFRGHSGPVGCMALIPVEQSRSMMVSTNNSQPSGSLLATGSSDTTIRLWSLETGQMVQVLGFFVDQGGYRGDPNEQGYAQLAPDGSNHRGPVTTLAFVKGADILCSGSTDCTIRGWMAPTWICVIVLDTHAASITNLELMNDEMLYSSGADGAVHCWSFERQYVGQAGQALPVAHLRTTFSPFNEHTARNFKNNYQEPIYGSFNTFSNQNVPLGHSRHPMAFHPVSDRAPAETVTCYCKVGKYLCIGAMDGTVCIYDEQGSIVRRLTGHTSTITSCKALLNRLLLTASADGTVRIWNQQVLFSPLNRTEVVTVGASMPNSLMMGAPMSMSNNLTMSAPLPMPAVMQVPTVLPVINPQPTLVKKQNKQAKKIVIVDDDDDDSGTEIQDLRSIATQTKRAAAAAAEKKKKQEKKIISIIREKETPAPKRSDYDPAYVSMRNYQHDVSLMSMAAEVAVERALRRVEAQNNYEGGRLSLPPILPNQSTKRNNGGSRAWSLPSASDARAVRKGSVPANGFDDDDDDDQYFQELDYSPSQVIRRK